MKVVQSQLGHLLGTIAAYSLFFPTCREVAAGFIPPQVSFSDGITAIVVPPDSFLFDASSNRALSQGATVAPSGFRFMWALEAGDQASISGTIAVFNFTSQQQDYYLTYLQPMDGRPLVAASSRGSIELAVQDYLHSGSAFLGSVGDHPVYGAYLDGVLQRTLLDDLNLETDGNAIGHAMGEFGPLHGGPHVLREMAVTVSFCVSSFDLASGSIYYAVVPEPAAWQGVALCFLGCFLFWYRRTGREYYQPRTLRRTLPGTSCH